MLEIQHEIRVPTPLIELDEDIFRQKRLRVFLKADYLTHTQLSGNKWRKLKYNLVAAQKLGKSKLLSFGGAYSNHIYALGGVAKLTDFEVHCVIRGNELTTNSNETLTYANQNGVKLHFVTRMAYRDKVAIAKRFGDDFYVIPEGGTNQEALLGMSEVIDELVDVMSPDVIVAAMGTGGTVAGLLSNNRFEGKIIGIPVLKNGFGLLHDVSNLVDFDETKFTLLPDYHAGGYGKRSPALQNFACDFFLKHQIRLDEVYTVKMVMGVYELIRLDYFAPEQQLVIYHSGGLR